jgi:hypothetical protein
MERAWSPYPPTVTCDLDDAQEVVQGVHKLLLSPSHDEMVVVVQDIDHSVLHDPGFPYLLPNICRAQPVTHGIA